MFKRPYSPLFWIALLYFAQGFPFGVFYELMPVYLRTIGVDLRSIGFLSLIGLAWTLKFLWSPLVDRVSHPARWIFVMCLLYALVTLLIPYIGEVVPLSFVLFLATVMAVASATNDIAIDGYSIRFLEGKNIGKANGVRVAAWRVGLFVCGGLLMLKEYGSWESVFVAASIILMLMALIAIMIPRLPTVSRKPLHASFDLFRQNRLFFLMVGFGFFLFILWMIDARKPILKPLLTTFTQWTTHESIPILNHIMWSEIITWPALWIGFACLGLMVFLLKNKRNPSNATLKTTPSALRIRDEGGIMALLMRPGMGPVLLFILLFKLADSSMGFMIKPFWVDSGFSPQEIGFFSINIGIILSILGSLVGGWYTDRVGIFKSLWVMGIWQIASNGVYALAAWLLPQWGTTIGLEHRMVIYSASAFESFTGGLGTASFLAMLMALVNVRYAATEYATLSAIFAASRSVAGFIGGFGAYHFGYAPYFAITMLLGLPAYFLLPWVKQAIDQISIKDKTASLANNSTEVES